MDELAEQAETINYEMACAFGTMRVSNARASSPSDTPARTAVLDRFVKN